MKIAVTGLNATDNPGPGVPVIRSLKESKDIKFEIIGLIYDSLEPGIYMENLTDKCYVIPYPSSGLDSLLQRILYINEKEKIDMIIPTLDSELYAFNKISAALNKEGIKTYLPTIEQLTIRGKDKLFDFCKSKNIKVPKNILVTSFNDLHSVNNKFTFPVVVKGIFYEAYIVHNFEEMLTAYNKLTAKWGFPIIVQEFIRGDELNVVALGDGTGNMVGAVAMKKLYITDKGKGWAGVTIKESSILSIAEEFIKVSKWKSGMELEFIKSKETNEYYLLEINPRFPAWVYLAPSAGQNLPEAIVKLANGEKVEQFKDFEIGKIFVRSSWDLITNMKTFEKIAVLGEI